MQPTRQKILDFLQRYGRATVKELGQALDLTSTGIRQHLTVLEKDGLIRAREERGRVGRPALLYVLTTKAEGLFPKNYDQLALSLLEQTRAISGGDGLQSLLHHVAGSLAAPHLSRVEGRPLEERAEEAAAVLREQGCLADAGLDGADVVVREYTCPYASVARQNSAVCILHVDFINRLTGGEVKLTTSLLRGDRACTYRIRPRPVETLARRTSPAA